MKKKYIIALDQGTTSSRAIIFNREQDVIASAMKEFPQIYPVEGWVEHDPVEIWSSQYAVMMEAIAESGIDAKDIAAIGITNQRETAILWDRNTGKPVYNAIVWQCRRTSEMTDRLVAEGHGDYIRKITGLVPDAYFSGTKIQWILDHVPGAREKAERGDILFGTVDTWLIWKLTGGRVHATDYTNASRTMLFDIRKLDWDEKLLSLMEIPRAILPELRPSSDIYGTVNIQGTDIPLASAAGDQQAALFGQCCFEKGEAKNTYGTGCFLLMNTGSEPCESRNGLVATVAAGTGRRENPGEIRYALEGSVFAGGSVIQWLRDEMGIISSARDSGIIAARVSDTGGVCIVPAFTGLGAPWWDQYARGTITGITRGTRREHIIRAAEESIAYQSLDVLRAMEKDTGHEIGELRVDGGAAGDNFLMQFQADIMDCRIARPRVRETTALGAAYLAGLATGFWSDPGELRALWKEEARFTPRMDGETRGRLVALWHGAVRRSLSGRDSPGETA